MQGSSEASRHWDSADIPAFRSGLHPTPPAEGAYIGPVAPSMELVQFPRTLGEPYLCVRSSYPGFKIWLGDVPSHFNHQTVILSTRQLFSSTFR